MFQPVIKWSGSKRSQAEDIIRQFPKEIDTYYEPFCGGCSVLRALLESEVKVNNFVCSDLNQDLINTWDKIKLFPASLCAAYERMWNEMYAMEDKADKRSYFEKVREQLNKTHSEYDFFFIMRTCTNGMPRYNKNGEFNNSFHITRDGINPETMKSIIMEWSDLLNKHDVTFKGCSFEDIQPENENDFVYIDPPYNGTMGMYYGKIDNNKLWNYLRSLKCGYAFSYDGISGVDNRVYNVPKDVYSHQLLMRSGNSSFKRVIGNSNDTIVYESLYLK